METYSPTESSGESAEHELDLITNVDVQKMTHHDSKAIEPVLDELGRREVKPEVIVGDNHCDSTEMTRRITESGVEILAPSMPPKGCKLGRLNLEDFELDAMGVVVSCPAGNAPVSTFQSKKRTEIQFDQHHCRQCAERQRYPGYASQPGRNIRLPELHNAVAG